MEYEIIAVVKSFMWVLIDFILLEWLEDYSGEKNDGKNGVVWERIVRSWGGLLVVSGLEVYG